MSLTFITGIIGSLTLVSGAACPEPKKKTHPAKSLKNWLFAIGGVLMLLYALFNHLSGGPILFVILELQILIASVLMMLNVPDRVDIPVITVSTIVLVIWSLTQIDDPSTLIFIFGLGGMGLGYTLEMHSQKRNLALTLGSILIALYSLIQSDWIFFWLNVFFAVFSSYYLYIGQFKKTRSNTKLSKTEK